MMEVGKSNHFKLIQTISNYFKPLQTKSNNIKPFQTTSKQITFLSQKFTIFALD
jgi:hypothetical protein